MNNEDIIIQKFKNRYGFNVVSQPETETYYKNIGEFKHCDDAFVFLSYAGLISNIMIMETIKSDGIPQKNYKFFDRNGDIIDLGLVYDCKFDFDTKHNSETLPTGLLCLSLWNGTDGEEYYCDMLGNMAQNKEELLEKSKAYFNYIETGNLDKISPKHFLDNKFLEAICRIEYELLKQNTMTIDKKTFNKLLAKKEKEIKEILSIAYEEYNLSKKDKKIKLEQISLF